MGDRARRGSPARYVDNSYVALLLSPTLDPMNWDRLFDDLEGQLASEWEAERAALDAESERVRISQLDLRTRLRTMSARNASIVIEFMNGRRMPMTLRIVGADWLAAETSPAPGTVVGRSMLVIPVRAIQSIGSDHGMLLGSLEEEITPPSALRERMTLGFVLRDLARRRIPLHLSTTRGDDVHGTIDRAGADHLDLALHDPGTARLASAVQSFRIVPFAALLTIRLVGDQRL